jgi:hypothetical protein
VGRVNEGVADIPRLISAVHWIGFKCGAFGAFGSLLTSLHIETMLAISGHGFANSPKAASQP